MGSNFMCFVPFVVIYSESDFLLCAFTRDTPIPTGARSAPYKTLFAPFAFFAANSSDSEFRRGYFCPNSAIASLTKRRSMYSLGFRFGLIFNAIACHCAINSTPFSVGTGTSASRII